MKNIMCFGDSNTFGYNGAKDERYSYDVRFPGVMAGLLGSGYYIIEEGLPGRTTVFDDPMTEGLCGLQMITPLLMSHTPLDTLIIMLGTNDSKERFGVSAGMIGKGMRRLVEKALATDAWRDKADILVVSPTPILPCYIEFDTLGGFGAGADQKSAGVASAYENVTRELGVRFFDAGTVITADTADGVHLTAQGHRILGKALAELVK